MRFCLILFTLCCCLRCATTLSQSPTITAMGTLSLLEPTTTGELVIPGQQYAPYLRALTQWASDRRITILFTAEPLTLTHESQSETLFGLTILDTSGRRIFIDASASVNTQFATLLHELGHVYHAGNLSSAAGEIFAELVAYQVCQRLGLDIGPQSAAYLSTKGSVDFQWTAAMTFNRDVDAVVAMLTAASQGKD